MHQVYSQLVHARNGNGNSSSSSGGNRKPKAKKNKTRNTYADDPLAHPVNQTGNSTPGSTGPQRIEVEDASDSSYTEETVPPEDQGGGTIFGNPRNDRNNNGSSFFGFGGR